MRTETLTSEQTLKEQLVQILERWVTLWFEILWLQIVHCRELKVHFCYNSKIQLIITCLTSHTTKELAN